MLAVTSSPLSFTTISSSCKDDDHHIQIQMQMQMQMQSDMDKGGGEGSFCDYFDEKLLDTIDLDDLFIDEDDDDILLPDLEMDPENNILSQFPLSSTNGSFQQLHIIENPNHHYLTTSDFGSTNLTKTTSQSGTGTADREQEVQEEQEEEAEQKGRKSSSSKSSKIAGKKKVKVDWTPELHRRFVEAVEQLGVDKAVPCRILELMGMGASIHTLTRHNIASHLQKYRSHRKHLLAREAEASNWSKKRQQLYCPLPPATTTSTTGGGGGKRDMNTWRVNPAIGFPPPPLMTHFRPLHVWGHPSVHQSLMHVWPKHLGPSSPTLMPPPPSWASAAAHPPPTPAPRPPDPSFWHSHHHLHTYHVPGIPAPPTGVIGVPRQALSQLPPLDFHPSKESIDAVLGDVMSKPWLPLPLGLKPPSVDGVMVELQRQGVPTIPPRRPFTFNNSTTFLSSC